MAEARIASPEPQPQAQTTESQAQTPEQSSVALTASFAGDGALAANVDIVQHHTVQFASEGTLQAYISPQQPATNMNAATLNYNNSTGQQLPIPAPEDEAQDDPNQPQINTAWPASTRPSQMHVPSHIQYRTTQVPIRGRLRHPTNFYRPQLITTVVSPSLAANMNKHGNPQFRRLTGKAD